MEVERTSEPFLGGFWPFQSMMQKIFEKYFKIVFMLY